MATITTLISTRSPMPSISRSIMPTAPLRNSIHGTAAMNTCPFRKAWKISDSTSLTSLGITRQRRAVRKCATMAIFSLRLSPDLRLRPSSYMKSTLRTSSNMRHRRVTPHAQSRMRTPKWIQSHKLVYMTPETGGFLQTTHTSGNFLTALWPAELHQHFRQARDFGYRWSGIPGDETSGDKSLVLGYDEQLQSSATHTVDFGTLSQMSNSPYFQMNGSPFPCNQFAFTPYLENGMGIVKEVRHRYGSGYFNATYTYDNKYNIFGSFRKTMPTSTVPTPSSVADPCGR